MLYGIVLTRSEEGKGSDLFGFIRRFEKQSVPAEIKVVSLFADLVTCTPALITSNRRPLREIDRLYNEKLDAGYHGILRGEVMTVETDLDEKQIARKMRKVIEAVAESGGLAPYVFADLIENIGSKAHLLAEKKLRNAVSRLGLAAPEWGF